MQYEDLIVEDVVVLALSGKMWAYEDSAPIRAKIKIYLDGERKSFVLDLAGVPWINSEGIGFLASTMASVAKAGGRIVLANTNEKVEKVLAITRCSTIMKHFGNRQEAIEYLSGANASA